MMRHLYTIGFYCALPFIAMRALWRTRKIEHRLRRMGERIGILPNNEVESIWLHAVSYGEAVAAEPLIRHLKLSYPTDLIVITTMTLTGALRVESSWRQDSQIQHRFLPYDIPFAIKRFFKSIKPKIGIIMETELWPNLLHLAGKQSVPLLLANARLSPRSYQGYQRITKLISPELKHINVIAAQTKEDGDRFIGLGAPQTQVSVLGNLKFDIQPPDSLIAKGKTLRTQLPYAHIIVAASTHANEEEQLLNVFAKLRKAFPDSLLVLVPRHPERFNEVANLCTKQGYQVVRRSLGETPTAPNTIFLGDTMGELYFFYALADIAFVGGSLVPIGGHNLLEPAALKLPIATGPHLHNFVAISNLLLSTGTLHVAEHQGTLLEIFKKLLTDKANSQKTGEAGYEIIEKNKGATQRHIDVIASLLD